MAKQSVLITGCSAGGIGDALAQTFHAKNYRVFATARSLSRIQHLSAMGIETLILDVTSAASIQKAVAEVEQATGGRLDVLVNNSGQGYAMPLLDSDLEIARKVFDVNFFAVLAVTQAFSKMIIEAKGKIVNIGSITGRLPLPFLGESAMCEVSTL
jgi:1-acylglycerone phosphate reductase